MERQQFFCRDDRVRLIAPFDSLPSSACGRVQWVYFPVAVYRVLFDGEAESRLVYGPDLARETACEVAGACNTPHHAKL